MTFGTVSAEEMFAAQLLGGATMVLFIGSGFVRNQGHRIRVAALTLYLAGIAGFVVYFLVR